MSRAFQFASLFCLVAIAVVAWLPVSGNSPGAVRNACIANLMQIRDAKSDWAISFGITNLSVIPGVADLYGPRRCLPVELVCPGDGIYSIGRLGEAPRCSVPRHTL